MSQSIPNGTELGAYTIVRLIGRGGMGEVYEAYEHRLQRRVALKVISPAKAGSHGEVDLVRRFLQEARTLAQVNHPNVVTIYSIDRVNDVQFIAMEYVDGASFKDLYALFALSAVEAAPIFIQLLEGLRALHDNKILHRDIKPHNLMMRPNGQIKILDFGIAKRLNDREREQTTVGVVVGTLSYLPPEVLYGTPATVRSDLWSMGAIFYEALVGQPLVSLSSIKVKGVRAGDSDVIFPQDCLAWVPPEMRAIVSKMSDRVPDHRYANCAEVIEALKDFQHSYPPVTPCAMQALLTAVGDLDEIKEDTDVKALVDAKSKRAFTLSVMSGRAQTVIDVEIPKDDEPVISQVMKDSVSARRKAQARSRRGQFAWKQLEQWQKPAGVIFALILVFALIGKITGKKNVEKEPTSSTAPSQSITSDDVPPLVQPTLLTSPAEGETVWLELGQLPTLSWSKLLEPGEFELQIATDPKFNSIVVRETVSGTSYRPGHILQDGSYYWQLWPLKHGGVAVGPGRFGVSYLSPLELKWPRSDQVFELSRSQKTQTVSFKWKCKTGAKAYAVQLSNDPAFVTIVNEGQVKDCGWNDLKLPAGSYFWRVRVSDPSVAEISSAAKQSFTVHGAESPAPPVASYIPREKYSPPVQLVRLSTPKLKNAKQTITLKFARAENMRDIASVRKQIVELPQLDWTPVRGAQKYELQLSMKGDFSDLLSEETVNTTSYQWKQAVPGVMHWRVRAAHENGSSGPFSQAGVLTVTLPEPVLGLEYKFTGQQQIEWAPVPMAEKYIVQYSNDRSMASVQEKTIAEPRINLELGDKPVFVKVAAAGPSGERVSGFSQVSTITLEAPIRLGIPGLLTPPRGAKVPAPKSGRISVVFSWNPVEHADNYYIELSTYPDFSKVLAGKTIRGNRWVLKGAKFNGKVYWRVRSQNSTGQSGWSHPAGFEVR